MSTSPNEQLKQEKTQAKGETPPVARAADCVAHCISHCYSHNVTKRKPIKQG